MRKMLIVTLALALGLGMASLSFAGTSTQIFNISVIVSTNTTTIQLANTPLHSNANAWAIGTVAAGSSTVVGGGGTDARIIVQNVGDTPVNLSLDASSFTGAGTWTLLTTGTPGTAPTVIDTCRLSGIFTTYNNTAVLANFGANDIITGTPTAPVYPDPNVFGMDTESDLNVKGYGLLPTGDRSLKLEFDAPIAGSHGLGLSEGSNITILATSY